ncbi:hypothetical protein BROUX41_006073 [Berkeleyomyces rouxiae]
MVTSLRPKPSASDTSAPADATAGALGTGSTWLCGIAAPFRMRLEVVEGLDAFDGGRPRPDFAFEYGKLARGDGLLDGGLAEADDAELRADCVPFLGRNGGISS